MEIKLVENKNFIYKVKGGETLKDISQKFKISEVQILKTNCLESKNLMEGDCLFISEANNRLYVVKPLDTLNIVAKKLNVSEKYLIDKNNLINKRVFIGQVLCL